MDSVTPEMTLIFAARQPRRHRLAALPFPEKEKAVIRLQQMAAPLLRRQGKAARGWTTE